MTKEQEMKEFEFCVRVNIPIERPARMISEDEQIRIALGKFEKWFLEHDNLRFDILENPQVVGPYEYVTLAFCERHNIPETSVEIVNELLKRFRLNCLKELPSEWKASYIGTRINGELLPVYPI